VLSKLLDAGVLQPDRQQSGASNGPGTDTAEPLQRIPTSPLNAGPAGQSKAIDTMTAANSIKAHRPDCPTRSPLSISVSHIQPDLGGESILSQRASSTKDRRR